MGEAGAGGGAGGGGPHDHCVNLWAAPRSLSTTLMYSFAQRDDTEVVDEPLYAHWLHISGAQHPMREQVLASQSCSGAEVLEAVVFAPPRDGKMRFVKQMAKHCTPDIRAAALSRGRHVVLAREPLHVLGSFQEHVPPSLAETGLPDAVAIYSALRQAGKPVTVVDARDLSCNPEGTLRALCRALGLPFQRSMLSWPPGPRPEDGVWGPLWYKHLQSSSGFHVSPDPYASLLLRKGSGCMAESPELYSLLEECQPFYDLLRLRALRPDAPPPEAEGAAAEEAAAEGAAAAGAGGVAGSETNSARHGSLHSRHAPDPPLPVPANKQLLVWVGDALLPRSAAKVHVLDSIAQGGDGTWEGLRVYGGRVFKLRDHLQRLQDSARALKFARVPSSEEITAALVATLAANGMRSNAHVRLTLTRGLKVTSGMSPHFNQYGCTLIVLAEWKPPVYDNERGVKLVTATTRRNPPQCLDSKIHHNNLLNNILAKIEGNNAGADDAVMLDINGFVSETNATNIFLVKNSRLLSPATAHCCLPGITRQTVLDLGRAEGIPTEEGSISVAELHSADEIFTTGTMGELTPCVSIDNRVVGEGRVGPTTRRLQAAYARLTAAEGFPLPNFPAAAMSTA